MNSVRQVRAFVAVKRSFHTSTRLGMKEDFRELRDLGFAPRFRSHHTRLTTKRPDTDKYYKWDNYNLELAFALSAWFYFKNYWLDERARDADRMIEYQFRDIDQAKGDKYEEYYTKVLAETDVVL